MNKHGDNHDLWAFMGFRMGYCFNWQLMGNGFEACSIIAYGGYYLYVILVYRLICHLQSKFCFQFQGITSCLVTFWYEMSTPTFLDVA